MAAELGVDVAWLTTGANSPAWAKPEEKTLTAADALAPSPPFDPEVWRLIARLQARVTDVERELAELRRLYEAEVTRRENPAGSPDR